MQKLKGTEVINEHGVMEGSYLTVIVIGVTGLDKEKGEGKSFASISLGD